MAIPLMLFLLVNLDIIPEIVTPFMSVPRLISFRSGELITSPRAVIENFYRSLSMFIAQDDGSLQYTTPMFGLYYKFSNVFILIGIVITALNIWGKRKDEAQLSFPLMILFLCSIVIASTTEMVFYRLNMIHIPMTFFWQRVSGLSFL